MSPATRCSSTIPARSCRSRIRKTGEIREAEIFVGVLGASNYTYAEATWTPDPAGLDGSHVPHVSLLWRRPTPDCPDNLKSGVNRPGFYDPEINRSYGMMASHYGVGVLPARQKAAKDKAKVESGVRFAQSLHSRPAAQPDFLSLAEANAAIAGRL